MSGLSHVGPDGRARMVDVSAKDESERVARARGWISMSHDALDAVRGNRVAKGDVFAVARLAGIMGAKRTAELIPLCHPIALSDVEVSLQEDKELPGVRVEATAKAVGRTGVEMEAITAVSVTLITFYDMVKALDKAMTIGGIELMSKTGGKSGPWTRR